MPIVLITGGAGYIGSVLSAHLVSAGFTVRIFDQMYFGESAIKHLPPSAEVIKGDVRNPPSNLFRGVIAVIHLAGLSNDPTAEFNPAANYEINTDATRKLALQSKHAGVPRFIFASSCSIYDMGLLQDKSIQTENALVTPRSPYPLSKHKAEQELLQLQDKDFCVVILRKGTVYGFSPRMRYDLIVNTMVRDALQYGKIRVFCRGTQWRPIIAVEDVAQAYFLTLVAPQEVLRGQIFNISLGNFQVKDVAYTIQRVFEIKFRKKIDVIYEQDDKKDRSYRVSIKKAQKVLKFKPHTTVDMSVGSLVEHILKSKDLSCFNNPIFYNIQWMRPFLETRSSVLI